MTNEFEDTTGYFDEDGRLTVDLPATARRLRVRAHLFFRPFRTDHAASYHSTREPASTAETVEFEFNRRAALQVYLVPLRFLFEYERTSGMRDLKI